jgi:Spy/CpxP family protein refolding chaperone
MKKLTPALILIAALAATSTAQARDHRDDRNGPPRDGSVAMEMVGHMHRALKQLDLSAEQEEAIKAEFKAMKTDLRPLADAMRDNRAALHELLTAEDFDAEAVSAIADEQGQITADMVRLASSTIHAAKRELTEDQLAQLAEMREEHRQRLQKQLGQLQKKLERLDGNG